jgi:hypothetical protein
MLNGQVSFGVKEAVHLIRSAGHHISSSTLRKKCKANTGPEFKEVNGRLCFTPENIITWADTAEFRSPPGHEDLFQGISGGIPPGKVLIVCVPEKRNGELKQALRFYLPPEFIPTGSYKPSQHITRTEDLEDYEWIVVPEGLTSLGKRSRFDTHFGLDEQNHDLHLGAKLYSSREDLMPDLKAKMRMWGSVTRYEDGTIKIVGDPDTIFRPPISVPKKEKEIEASLQQSYVLPSSWTTMSDENKISYIQFLLQDLKG